MWPDPRKPGLEAASSLARGGREGQRALVQDGQAGGPACPLRSTDSNCRGTVVVPCPVPSAQAGDSALCLPDPEPISVSARCIWAQFCPRGPQATATRTFAQLAHRAEDSGCRPSSLASCAQSCGYTDPVLPAGPLSMGFPSHIPPSCLTLQAG